VEVTRSSTKWRTSKLDGFQCVLWLAMEASEWPQFSLAT